MLPPILPVVLYNGEQRWTAPLSLGELFKPRKGFDLPDFRYIVLDVKRFAPEQLRPVEAVSSGLFLMEQANDVGESPSDGDAGRPGDDVKARQAALGAPDGAPLPLVHRVLPTSWAKISSSL